MNTDKIAIIAVTERGRDLALSLTKTVPGTVFVPEKHKNEQTAVLTPFFVQQCVKFSRRIRH